MSRSTFNILFYANKGKEKNGIVPIMGRVTINGTQSQFSCKMSIPLTMWDVKGNCAKGRSKEALQINRDLDNIKAQIIKHYQHLSDREGFVTADHLKTNGVEVELVMKRNGSKDIEDLQGMRFTKDGITIKASQIKRGLSVTAIVSKLESNAKKEQQRTTINQQQTRRSELPRQETHYEHQEHEASPVGIPSLGLFDTSNPVYDPSEEDFRRRMQKKKKKRGLKL